MNRIITQWFLVIGLLILGWAANAVVAVLEWAQQNLLLILLSIGVLITLFLIMIFLPALDRNKDFLAQEHIEDKNLEKIAEIEKDSEKTEYIEKAIRETPKLSRYAWSGNTVELFSQWELYESTGVTPVRRKTEARRNRDKGQKLMLQSPAIDLSKIVWKGKMSCNKCQYLWQSRKLSPPARCLKCNSSNLTVLRVRVPL